MDRRTYLGGSDIAAICGAHPYKTAHDVWMQKRGLVGEKDSNLAMRIGLLAEPMLSSLYEEHTGRALTTVEPLKHRDYEFIGGSPDRVTHDREMSVELKTANLRTLPRWGEEGTDEVPEEYLLQVALYLSLLDHGRADLAVLLGGSEFRVYTILRDRELEAAMLDRAAKFWRDNVVGGKPPEVDGSEGAKSLLATLYPNDGIEMLEPTPEVEALVRDYAAAKAAQDGWELRAETLKQKIQAAIGDKRGVSTSAGTVLWTACRGKVATDWKALSAEVAPEVLQRHTRIGKGFRRFTLKAVKES